MEWEIYGKSIEDFRTPGVVVKTMQNSLMDHWQQSNAFMNRLLLV